MKTLLNLLGFTNCDIKADRIKQRIATEVWGMVRGKRRADDAPK